MTPSDYDTYHFEYHFQGETWGFEVIAKSPEEAQERIKAMGWAQYIGSGGIKMKVSPSMTGWGLLILAFLFCIAITLGVFV